METTVPSVEDARTLADAFRGAGYTQSAIEARIGDIQAAIRATSHGISGEHEPPQGPLGLMIHWFAVGSSVPRPLAENLVTEHFIRLALGHGLLIERGDLLHPGMSILPQGELLIAGDLYGDHGIDEPVLPVSAPARMLLNHTIERRVESFLDLCAGNGLHGLAAAGRADLVVATDLSPRALTFATLNARLNDIDNFEPLEGSAFEPVAGQSFDQIVCHPPFIVTPSRRYIYSDNELDLDDFCKSVVRSAPGHLKEGGFFQMICEWVELRGQNWRERLAGWFEDSGCDAWVIELTSMDPADYVEFHGTTISGRPAAPGHEHDVTPAKWLDYLRESEVEAIHGGFVMMRRRTGDNWVDFTENQNDLRPAPGGPIIERGFAARDFLHRHRDSTLLEKRPVLAPGVEINQASTWNDGWKRSGLSIRSTEGFSAFIETTEEVLQFVTRLDGSRTIDELSHELASRVEQPLPEVQVECCRIVRRMLRLGLLLPPRPTTSSPERD